jgi:predicted transcriptional regulator
MNGLNMQLRIVRRIPMDEVRQRVAVFEAKYEGHLEGIPYQFAEGQIKREAFEDYVEWMGMEHALRAYSEGEDYDYFTEDILELGDDEISKLTPRRMELMDQMSRYRVDSINDLATRIDRDVKNVYNDLKTLEGLGFVRLIKEGRRLIPDLLVKEITLLTW